MASRWRLSRPICFSSAQIIQSMNARAGTNGTSSKVRLTIAIPSGARQKARCKMPPSAPLNGRFCLHWRPPLVTMEQSTCKDFVKGEERQTRQRRFSFASHRRTMVSPARCARMAACPEVATKRGFLPHRPQSDRNFMLIPRRSNRNASYGADRNRTISCITRAFWSV
jgi:hypothetical protein